MITRPDQKTFVPASSGRGMPAKSPQLEISRPGRPSTPRDNAAEASLELPHERDQATDMTAEGVSPLVEQAAKDLQHGLKDTSKGPEMDNAYKKLKQ